MPAPPPLPSSKQHETRRASGRAACSSCQYHYYRPPAWRGNLGTPLATSRPKRLGRASVSKQAASVRPGLVGRGGHPPALSRSVCVRASCATPVPVASTAYQSLQRPQSFKPTTSVERPVACPSKHQATHRTKHPSLTERTSAAHLHCSA
ncbi:MAG: hypothetical protein WDW38_005949 [Sanguina aurantia]